MSVEEQPFLYSDKHERSSGSTDPGDDVNDHHSAIAKNAHRKYSRGLVALLIANLLFLVFNVSSYVLIHGKANESHGSGAFFSPAQEAMRTVIDTGYEPHGQSPYFGSPNGDVDLAWDRLLRPTELVLSEQEMRRLNLTSVAMKDGSGYVAYLEAFHQLHCVKRIYQTRYPEHYSDLAEAGKLTDYHWEHCLEVLRKNIMCNADIAVVSVEYDPEDPTRLTAGTRAPRMCADWDHLHEWATQRTIGGHDELIAGHDEPGSVGP